MQKKELTILQKIAEEHLFLNTLETQNCSLDFNEQAVWSIKKALEEAYKAGQKNPKKQTKETAP